MSHPVNEQIKEFLQEKREGAYKPEIVYPEGSVIDGNPLISEAWLERKEEEREWEKLKIWDETKGIINDIY